MRRAIALLAVLGLVVAGAGCGGDDDDAGGTTTSRESTTSTAAATTSTSLPAADETTLVYFTWNELIGTAGRPLDSDERERGALAALLEGPDGFETDIGMGTAIPDGTELLGLTIDRGRATVDLSGKFQSGGGSLSMQLRTAQVVFTLTQFDTVETITVHIDGTEVEGIGGEGIPAADLTRADFENVIPAILVEAPVPGETVTSPLAVSGISNTFEANVRYAVNDPEGLILDEGFTTGGTGRWAPFAFTSEFSTDRTGLGSVVVWEDSPDTGDQANVYEVPVRMG
jgi:hypothetical protein